MVRGCYGRGGWVGWGCCCAGLIVKWRAGGVAGLSSRCLGEDGGGRGRWEW